MCNIKILPLFCKGYKIHFYPTLQLLLFKEKICNCINVRPLVSLQVYVTLLRCILDIFPPSKYTYFAGGVYIHEVCSKSNENFHFYQTIFIYLSILILSSSKYSTLDTIDLCQRFFQSLKHL